MSAGLELRLFGPPRIRLSGVDVRFDTRKAVAILAFLAVSGREHSRAGLAAMLWPDLDRVRSRAVLRRTLSVATAVGPALEVTPAAVRLDAARTDCDVREFRMLAGGDSAAHWRRAADLAGERFLDGFALRDSPEFEDWQFATADALTDELSRVLARLVAEEVADGDFTAALAHAHRRTRVDPLSEPAHVDFIRVTAWTGDRSAALQAYRALVRMLDRELGVPPLPATMAVHDAIRADRLASPPSRPRVAAASSVAAPPRPVSAPVVTELVGRERELDRLRAIWRESADRGAAIGIVGDLGMGKSALARRFSAEVAEAGASVLVLSGHAAESSLAYGAANDLVRAMLVLRPTLAAELGAAGEPLGTLSGEFAASPLGISSAADLERLYEAVRVAATTLATDGRMLLVVDDAHLLDPQSASLLSYLLRHLPAGARSIVTWLSGTGGARLPEAVIESSPVLTVSPLDLDGVTALVGGAAHDPAEVLHRTRGVPLLVWEYATSDAPATDARPSDAPAERARDVVAARLEAASAETRQLVGAAAVIGTVADPELLRATCGRDEAETVDAIEEAIARGLLVERLDRPGYDVPHELVREAALARLSLARGRLLHGRVADVLTRRHGVDPLATPAASIARHLAAAGRDDEAAVWFVTAAEDSSRVAAHEDAIAQLRAALALGHPAREIHHATGVALVRLGRYDDALVALDQAAALAEADPMSQAEIEHAIAGVHDRRGDWDLAHAHLASARDLVSDDSTGRRARILADLALIRHRQGLSAEARALAAEAAGLAAASHGDDAALAQASNVLGMLATADGDHPEARRRLVEAVALARRLGDTDLLIAALNNLSRAALAAGRFGSGLAAGDADAALAAAREALDLAERQGDRHRLAALHSHLADLLHAVGDDDEALAALKRSAESFAQVHGSFAHVHGLELRPEVWTLTEW